jgi:hypothetical protein
MNLGVTGCENVKWLTFSQSQPYTLLQDSFKIRETRIFTENRLLLLYFLVFKIEDRKAQDKSHITVIYDEPVSLSTN